MAKKVSHYDGYDYSKYWKERIYEHECEIYAIKGLINHIGKTKKNIIDIGCGFGRLLPAYYSAKSQITLLDPSQNLLDKASQKYFEMKNIKYVKGEIDSLKKLPKNSYDLAIIVRVLHHIEDLSEAFSLIHSVLKSDGYLILEYANKMHGKDQVINFLHGNITFPLEIFPVDKRSKKNKNMECIPFLNFHPDDIRQRLKKHGFKIIEKRSVSNFRNKRIKKIIGEKNLFNLEKCIQKPLSHIYFGPSIFILAKKV